MIVVQNVAKRLWFEIQDGRHAHLIGNSVSGERYSTTLVLLFIFILWQLWDCIKRTHGAGPVAIDTFRWGSGGTSLGKWQHNNNNKEGLWLLIVVHWTCLMWIGIMGNNDYLSGGYDKSRCVDLPGKFCYEKLGKHTTENDYMSMPENLDKNLEQQSYTECVSHENYYSAFPAHPSSLYPGLPPPPPPPPKKKNQI